MKEFLKENIHYPQKVQPKLNTQNNEYFNKLKTKYLRKDFKFSTSTELRYSLAILDWNEDGCWEEKVFERLSIDHLNSPYHEMLEGMKLTQCKKNDKKRESSFKDQRRITRKKEMQEKKKSK